MVWMEKSSENVVRRDLISQKPVPTETSLRCAKAKHILENDLISDFRLAARLFWQKRPSGCVLKA